MGQKVRLELVVHRFRCHHRACPRNTFVERLPEVVPFYGRRTCRLTTTLQALALEVGAEVGARIGRQFGVETSGTTLLRLARQVPEGQHAEPRVVGIDDWALTRAYATARS